MVIVSFAAETAQAVEECLPITLHEKKETVSPYSDLIQEKENMEEKERQGGLKTLVGYMPLPS